MLNYFFSDSSLPVRLVFGSVSVVQCSMSMKFTIFEFSNIRRSRWKRKFCFTLKSKNEIEINRLNFFYSKSLPLITNLTVVITTGPIVFIGRTYCVSHEKTKWKWNIVHHLIEISLDNRLKLNRCRLILLLKNDSYWIAFQIKPNINGFFALQIHRFRIFRQWWRQAFLTIFKMQFFIVRIRLRTRWAIKYQQKESQSMIIFLMITIDFKEMMTKNIIRWNGSIFIINDFQFCYKIEMDHVHY